MRGSFYVSPPETAVFNCSQRPYRTTLSPDRTLVKRQLFTFQDIAIAATALTWPRRNNGIQTTCLELPLQGRLNLSLCLQSFLLLLLDALALLLFLGRLTGSLLPLPSEARAVMRLVPLPERCSIDLDHGTLRQSIRTHKLVVRRVEDDTDDTRLASRTLRTPREVAGIEAKGTEFAVAAARADEVDALSADTSVGRLATFLESSVACRVRGHGTWQKRSVYEIWVVAYLFLR